MESEVLEELKLINGSKKTLMEAYIKQQKNILEKHGGHFNDLPASSDHPDAKAYYRLQAKINVLGKM